MSILKKLSLHLAVIKNTALKGVYLVICFLFHLVSFVSKYKIEDLRKS